MPNPLGESNPCYPGVPSVGRHEHLAKGDAGGGDHGDQRHHFNDKPPDFKPVLFAISYLLTIHFGHWKLKFSDDVLRGLVLLVFGIACPRIADRPVGRLGQNTEQMSERPPYHACGSHTV